MIEKDGNTTSFKFEIKVIDYKTDRLEYFKTIFLTREEAEKALKRGD